MNMDLRGKVKFLTGGNGSFLRERSSARDSLRSVSNMNAATDLVQFQGRR